VLDLSMILYPDKKGLKCLLNIENSVTYTF
jgi:hypothetical protein